MDVQLNLSLLIAQIDNICVRFQVVMPLIFSISIWPIAFGGNRSSLATLLWLVTVIMSITYDIIKRFRLYFSMVISYQSLLGLYRFILLALHPIAPYNSSPVGIFSCEACLPLASPTCPHLDCARTLSVLLISQVMLLVIFHLLAKFRWAPWSSRRSRVRYCSGANFIKISPH